MSDLHKSSEKQSKDHFLMQGMILAVAMVLTKVIGVVYRVPLINILGDEGHGFYGYAFEVYALALMLSSLSLPTAVSKLVAERMAIGQKRNAFRVFLYSLGFAFFVGLAVALFIYFGAGFIAAGIMESPLSIYALKVLAPGLFIVALLGVMRGYFQGLGTMMPTAVSQVIEQIVNAVVSIAGAGILYQIGETAAEKAGEELLGPAYGAAGGTLGTVSGAVSALIFLLFVFYIYRKSIRRKLRQDKTRRKESGGQIIKILLLTIAPVIFSTAIYNINQILDLTFFNKIMASQGFVEKQYMALQGIYTGKYNTLINVPLAMANGLAASVIPSITASVAAGKQKEVHQKIDQVIRLTMLIAMPCFAGFVVLASPLMILLYNDSSFTPAALLALGAVTVILYSWSTVSNSILQGLDKMAVPAKNAGISLAVHLAALFIMLLVFKWNIYSLVASNIVFSLCMCILNARAIHSVCRYRQEKDRTFFRPFFAAAIMAVAAYAAYFLLHLLFKGRFAATLLSVFIAALVYGISILKLGILSDEDIRSLPQGKKIYQVLKKLRLLPGRRIF